MSYLSSPSENENHLGENETMKHIIHITGQMVTDILLSSRYLIVEFFADVSYYVLFEGNVCLVFSCQDECSVCFKDSRRAGCYQFYSSPY